MAHYALLNEDNVVVQVITGRDEDDTTAGVTDWEDWYSNETGYVCKRTSYNTNKEIIRIDENTWEYGNSFHKNGKTPFRGKFASIGDIYDAERDEFITPQNQAE